MKIRIVLATLCVAASTSVLHASPIRSTSPLHASFAHEKMVHFQLRNGTGAPMKVMAGSTEMTLEPGKLTTMKLPVGTVITAVDASAHYAQGSVLATISTALSDATVTLD